MSDQVATEPDDDIYDVCPTVSKTVSGVNNLKTMFESSNILPIKTKPPVSLKPKPGVAEKNGGPPSLPSKTNGKTPPALPSKKNDSKSAPDVPAKNKDSKSPPRKTSNSGINPSEIIAKASALAAKRPNYTEVTKLKKPPPAPAVKPVLKNSNLPNGVAWPPPPPAAEEEEKSDNVQKDSSSSDNITKEDTVSAGSKQFVKLNLPAENGLAPPKPQLPTKVDIEDLREKHAAYEDEDFYDDVEQRDEEDAREPDETIQNIRPVSEIPEMSEMDDNGQFEEIYDDTLPAEIPQEIYDDVQ